MENFGCTRLYSLPLSQVRTYLYSLVFIAGNLILPQLCHTVPQGGITLLPIYFFTLIAAYKFGIGVGLLTAIASPLANAFLFGMPSMEVLPGILVKSIALAIFAAVLARKFSSVSWLSIMLVVLAYQVVGILFEWAWIGSFQKAAQDLYIGLPGILIQIFGGYLLLKALAKY